MRPRRASDALERRLKVFERLPASMRPTGLLMSQIAAESTLGYPDA